MKVLVTGGAGYIGSVLVPRLLADGHAVRVVDNFRYGQHLALAACCADPRLEIVWADVRGLNQVFFWPDVVIPLAAIVGAPACDRAPDDATAINLRAISDMPLSTEQIVIYPNTNSGYGATGDEPCDEGAPLRPVSLYGRLKCDAEARVMERRNSVTFRLATVFGASPRMRTDLLANDLTLRAWCDRSASLYQPEARRNFVHVRDVAEAFVFVIENFAAMRGRVYNLGNDECNVTKRQLCEAIARRVDGFRWTEIDGEDPDKRDYLVSNARLAAAGFSATRSLDDGIAELLRLYSGFPQHRYGNV